MKIILDWTNRQSLLTLLRFTGIWFSGTSADLFLPEFSFYNTTPRLKTPSKITQFLYLLYEVDKPIFIITLIQNLSQFTENYNIQVPHQLKYIREYIGSYARSDAIWIL